jgi:hypothetical protein
MTRSPRLAALLAAVCVPWLAAVPAHAQTAAADATATQPQAPQGQSPAAAASPAPEAMPHTQIYYHAGVWDAFSGRTPKGVPVCGVGTTDPATGTTMSIRFDIDGSDTIFAASKPNWSIPDNTKVAVVLQVGSNPPWTLHTTGAKQSVEWTLDRNAIASFDEQFRDAGWMTVTFPDGNEAPWRLSLAGSTAISNAFGRCVTDLTSQYRATQAQAGAQGGGSTAPTPTQPFSQHASAAGSAH